jgi:serine/threonine-protein kinase
VRLYDFGVSETDSLYFVMELLDGLDLASLVQRFGPMPAARVVSVLRQACRSLAEAHEAGLLHRDIKPHNLFLCRLGVDFDVVKVLDFGLVKSVGEDDAHLTADGALTGTPAYMPPGARDGRPRRRDLRPLLSRLRGFLDAHRQARVLRGPDGHARPPRPHPPRTPLGDALGAPVPEAVERVVLDCLAKEPSRRPASALELDRRLAELERAEPWTQDEAQRWWREHLPQLSAPAPGGDGSDDLLSLQSID